MEMLTVMIIMSTTTFLIIFFNSFLLFLLQKKRSIAESVKLLMILLSLIRIIQVLLKIPMIYCIQKSSFCYDSTPGYRLPDNRTLNISTPNLLNFGYTTTYEIFLRWMIMVEGCLSVNRIFAVFFDGRYYTASKRYINYSLPITFFLVIVAFCHFIRIQKLEYSPGLPVPYISGSYFNPPFIILLPPWGSSPFFRRWIDYLESFFLFISLLNTTFDSAVYLKIKALKAISSMKTDGDKRLARTAIVTHFVELITMISGCWNSMRNKFNTINGEDIWSEEFHFGAFEANTVAQIVVTIFVLHYLWPREGEKTTTKATRTTTN